LLNISKEAATAEEVESIMNDTLSNIRFSIGQTGVKRTDITVGQITLYPIQDQTKTPVEITGYTANNTVTVLVHDVAQTGNIIGIAMEAGATSLQSITFELVDESAVYQEALAKAVLDAETKAQVIAETAQESLGNILMIKENGTSIDAAAQAISDTTAEEFAQFSLESIKLRVTAQVVVDYMIG